LAFVGRNTGSEEQPMKHRADQSPHFIRCCRERI
jgi:hypothetical protein